MGVQSDALLTFDQVTQIHHLNIKKKYNLVTNYHIMLWNNVTSSIILVRIQIL